MGADCDLLDDDGPHANMTPISESHTAGQRRARRDVNEPAYPAIVINTRTRIYNCAFSDFASGLDDGAGHNLGAFAQFCVSRYHPRRVYDSHETIAAASIFLEQFHSLG